MAGGTTPAEALEAQRRKRLELDARESNVELPVLGEGEDTFLRIRGAEDGRAADHDGRRQEIPRLEKIKGLRPQNHSLHRPRHPAQLFLQVEARQSGERGAASPPFSKEAGGLCRLRTQEVFRRM